MLATLFASRRRIALIAGLFTAVVSQAAPADDSALQAGCDAGNPLMCFELARVYLEGNAATPRNPARSLALLERACTLGAGPACNDAGVRWAKGLGGAPAPDLGKAIRFYVSACELKRGMGCLNAGQMFRLGEGTVVDLQKAHAHFTTACDLEEAKGCTELGIQFYEGKVVRQDRAKAISLMEKGCRLGSAVACKNVEIMKK